MFLSLAFELLISSYFDAAASHMCFAVACIAKCRKVWVQILIPLWTSSVIFETV